MTASMWTDLGVGIVMLIGLIGIVVPVLPGSVLIAGALIVWALEVGTGTAWVIAAVGITLIALGTVVKYAVPGRRMKQQGVPNSTLLLGLLLGIVGFFVIPVVGLFVGFVAGVYAAEARRVGSEHAWPATKNALKGVGLSILIELVAAMAAVATWVVGLVLVR